MVTRPDLLWCVLLVGCSAAYGQIDPAPTLSAAIIDAMVPPDLAHELALEVASFAAIGRSLPAETYALSSIGRRFRTDLTSQSLECPQGGACHLPGDPLLIRVDSVHVTLQGEAEVIASALYNVRGAVTRLGADRLFLKFAHSPAGWRLLERRRFGSH